MIGPSDSAIALIREHGLGGLGGYDGCPCTEFEVHSVRVQISCHKSGSGPRIYVSSGSMDYDLASLGEVAVVVADKFEQEWGRVYEVILNDRTYDGEEAFRKGAPLPQQHGGTDDSRSDGEP